MRDTVLLMLFLTMLGLTSLAHADGPYSGKVVDAETKDPIESAVVHMEWNKRQFWEGSIFYDAQETATDKNGDFYLPGLWILNPWAMLMVWPQISIYKDGYGSISGPWKALIEKELGAPKGTYILKIENKKPVFMLKKRSSIKDEEKYLWNIF